MEPRHDHGGAPERREGGRDPANPEAVVLVVTDDRRVADWTGEALAPVAHVRVTRSPRHAFTALMRGGYDALVVDLALGTGARGLARSAAHLETAVPVVALSESRRSMALEEAVQVRARCVLDGHSAPPEMLRLAVARIVGLVEAPGPRVVPVAS